MAFKDEHLQKLTLNLASDVDLYNDVIEHEKTLSETIAKREEDINKLNEEVEKLKKLNDDRMNQLINLVDKIPVGETSKNITFEQQVQAVKEKGWSK